MRGRHFPRVCRGCEAPLARKDDACWRCQEVWTDRQETGVDRSAPSRAEPRSLSDAQRQPVAASAPDVDVNRVAVAVG